MSYDVKRIRSHFPSLNTGLAFFDGPGGSQVPDVVGAAIADAITKPISNRNTNTESEKNAEEIVLGFRKAVGDLIDVDPNGVVYGRSWTQITYDFSRTLAKTWKAGDEIVVSRLDHDSNIRPWIQAAEAVGATIRWAEFDVATSELTVAAVEAVGGTDGCPSHARHVAGGLGHGECRAGGGVQVDEPRVAVHGERESPVGALHAYGAGAHARHHDGVGAHHVVVLPVDPPLAGDAGGGQEPDERVSRFQRAQTLERELLDIGQPGRWGHRPAVHRRVVGQRTVRDVGHDSAVMLHPHPAVSGDLADPDGVEIPLREDRFDLGFAAALDHQKHPLLRLGEHDLVGRHACFPLGHERHVDLDADAAARPHLAGRRGQPGRAHVLDADQGVGLHHLEAGFQEKFLHERVAHLHGRTLLR